MILLELVAIALLLLLNGVLALSELALMASRRGRLEQRARGGDRGARRALRLLDDPTAFLATVQIGITAVGILAGALSGATLGVHLARALDRLGLPAAVADTFGIGLVVVALTYLSLVVGELVPKRLALADPERAASLVARPLAALSGLALPLVWILRGSTNTVLRRLGVSLDAARRVTEEESRAIVAEGAQAGVVTPVERELLEGVMQIADRPVRAIMTPRVDVVWLDVAADPHAVQATIAATGHSRFPVARGRLDDLVGIVDVRQLFVAAPAGGAPDLAALATAPPMVHESTPVVRLIELLRRGRQRMAVVLDEYGAVEGIVTPVDVLTAIAGGLAQDAAEEPAAVRRADGSWLIDGRMELHRLERLLEQRNLDRGGRYQTLAGLVLWELGRMPRVGDGFRKGDLSFEVVDLDGRRIDKVLVTRADSAAQNAVSAID